MAHESIIRYLVSTYDLPPKLEDRLTGIAIRRVAELGFNGFDTIYRYVDRLVEKFDAPFGKRQPQSLTDQLNPDSDLALLDLIGISDPNLAHLSGEHVEVEKPEMISMKEVIDILGGVIRCIRYGFILTSM